MNGRSHSQSQLLSRKWTYGWTGPAQSPSNDGLHTLTPMGIVLDQRSYTAYWEIGMLPIPSKHFTQEQFPCFPSALTLT